jgi:hypothetical protein
MLNDDVIVILLTGLLQYFMIYLGGTTWGGDPDLDQQLEI